MATRALLRHIRTSGGLFTENILLKLRDFPEKTSLGKIESFLEKTKEIDRKRLIRLRINLWNWCKEKWDELEHQIVEWSFEETCKNWILPFLSQLSYDVEEYEPEGIDQLDDFKLSHQNVEIKDPYFHLIPLKENFDERINTNPNKKSYHTLIQQYINLNPEINWVIAINGRILRIYTKYYHVYSKGYLEFDLENIFADRDEKEFFVLFSLLHPTRFMQTKKGSLTLIAQFQKESNKEGVIIGEKLRENVQNAIELLGQQLIFQNTTFFNDIKTELIDIEDFFAELLRILYRIIFILYAEQREMLPGAGMLYFEQYSISNLRILAEKPIKREKEYDLWHRLFITFELLNRGNDFLKINCFNGALFKSQNIPIISRYELVITNDSVLQIIRLLTTTTRGNIRQRINFLEISVEEIGAIYEALLDYNPVCDSSNNYNFQLIPRLKERKDTGTYYTPKGLVDILIRTALVPVLEQKLNGIEDKQKQEKTLISLKVCDPACGGGSFLIAALDYLGHNLAIIQSGSHHPSENELRNARHEVLQYCIYGVDQNPLAVELTKISLWLHACVKEMPLNFLDHHIKCGNSLIGVTPFVQYESIRPEAFNALKGLSATEIPEEDKSFATRLKRQILEEKKATKKESRQKMLLEFEETQPDDEEEFKEYTKKYMELSDFPEKSINEMKKKEQYYQDLKDNNQYVLKRIIADTWTGAFFWAIDQENSNIAPTEYEYQTIKRGKGRKDLIERVKEISNEYRFFHWQIEFPDVFKRKNGGFDCILTNPPWDVLQFKEEEFFAGISKITSQHTQASRRAVIKELKEGNEKDRKIYEKYLKEWQKLGKFDNFLRNSDSFSLSAKGTLNTYALFVERCSHLLSQAGRVGMIVPTQIATSYYMQELFRDFILNRKLMSLFDFENRKRLFPIHRSFRFSLLTLGSLNASQGEIPMAFQCYVPEDVQEALEIIPKDGKNLKMFLKSLPETHRLFAFTIDDFRDLNPNTLTCPVFKTRHDAELIRHFYNQAPIFLRKDFRTNEVINNQWDFSFKQGLFNVSSDSEYFKNNDQDTLREKGGFPKDNDTNGGVWVVNNQEFLPFYEGRMIWLYDHRYNSSVMVQEEGRKRKAKSISTTVKQHKNLKFSAIPRFWVSRNLVDEKIPESYSREWFIGFRDVTGTTNERTMVLTVIPRIAIGHTLPLILSNVEPRKLCGLIANFSSFILDYIARQKLSGTHMTFYNVEQFPIFPPDFYNEELLDLIVPRVVELIYNSKDISAFALDCNYDRDPFKWDPERRPILQAELDAIFAHLYKISRTDLEYILDSFTKLKNSEESKYNGHYKTKKLILEAFDKISLKLNEQN